MSRFWRDDQDAMLKDHVAIHGEANWETVGLLIGKSGNSCNLRWNSHLKPGLDHKKIIDEEVITILRLNKQYGPRWAKIAKKLSEGRSDNLKRTANKIKNVFNGAAVKKRSELNLEVDSHLLHETMTNILTPPTTTPANFGYTDPSTFAGQTSDPRGQGFDYTLDDVRPFNFKDIDEALDYLYH